MASFNKVILIGNLTSDPEVKQTPGGSSVCTFNIAVNRRFAKDGQQNVDFITIVAWKERAEFVGKYFKKGKPILICGEIQTRTWSDKDGNRRTSTEVVADECGFVSSRENDSTGEISNENRIQKGAAYFPDAYMPSKSSSTEFEPVDDSTLPF